MSKRKKFPDNVVPVDFRRKEKKGKTMKELYPDAFAMFVDTRSKDPDDFSRAVLDACNEGEDEGRDQEK
ncbi:hypothetical protein [Desulfospira joergensenii]|uniref:hypothetical protein n=1 Tax=Desulfospira joergensenii TaxID=53329 RepID=UPI0003B79918|nr:hypothetical protein [Desulfospira joergensenii]